MNPSNSSPWEEWQLTAYALGECDQETAERIARAASSDAELAAEIAAIRRVSDQVSTVLRSESLPQLDAVKLDQIVSKAHLEMAPATERSSVRPATGSQPAPAAASKAHASKAHATKRMLVLAAATAACLLALLYVAAPQRARQLGQIDTTTSTSSDDKALRSAEGLSLGFGVSGGEEMRDESQTLAQEVPAEESLLRRRELRELEEQVAQAPASEVPQPSPAPNARPLPPAPFFGYGGGEAGGYGAGGYGGGGTPGRELGADTSRQAGGYGSGEASAANRPALESSASSGPVVSGPPASSPAAPGVGLDSLQSRLTKDDKKSSSFFYAEEARGRSYRGGDRFETVVDNPFQAVTEFPLSTFSIDVDSASYTKCRQLLLEANALPPPAAVRIEEFVNYFDYEYAGPDTDAPFGTELAVAMCPWQPEHRLVRIALQATRLELEQRPASNLVFLLDVSGSMNEPNKLPLVQEAMRMLSEQLNENDKVAIAVYAGAAGCVLEGTRGDRSEQIIAAINNLRAGGSTNGAQGIQLAYDLARDNFVPGGINRVILCTDGDFNVGVTGTDALVDLVAENARSRIFLTVLGFGMGNTNDAMMEQISNRGNGVYGFIDSRREAYRQMVQQLTGNLMTVAKDVKIQVEFNPHRVSSYRLIGYENRLLAAEDFNNDQKDAGEVGAGHRVTALYEIVPIGSEASQSTPGVDELRYQQRVATPPAAVEPADEVAQELLAVKLRYKQPEGDTSRLLTFPLRDEADDIRLEDSDFQWAACVAQFGMLLRHSPHLGSSNWSQLLEQATQAAGMTPDAPRQECLEMMRRAAQLSSGRTGSVKR